jgi:hypothetical protein
MSDRQILVLLTSFGIVFETVGHQSAEPSHPNSTTEQRRDVLGFR